MKTSQKPSPLCQTTQRVRQSLLLGLLVTAVASLCFVARYVNAAAGDVDITFNPGAGVAQMPPSQLGLNFTVNAFALQPDGKIIVVGRYEKIDDDKSIVARLNTDGSIDTSFSSPATVFFDYGDAVAVQPDGKILVGGSFFGLNGVHRTGIARLNANGALDSTFDQGPGALVGANTVGIVHALALQADGKILIGGAFDTYNGVSRNGIARLNADGSLDTSFNPGTGTTTAFSSVNAFALQADGKIVIGGSFTQYNGVARRNIARINPDGSLDTSFNPGTGTTSVVRSLVLQPDGKILLGGGFSQFNGTSRNGIARVNTNGTLDTTFDPGAGAVSVNALALQPDGKVLIGGTFTQYNGVGRSGIARTNANGSLDTTFNPGAGTSSVNALALQPGGKVLVGGGLVTGGGFIQYDGVRRNGVARANADGSLDTSFVLAAPVGSSVRTIAVQPDGKILIAGFFTHYGGVARKNIARLNADGSLDTSFNPGTGTSGDTIFFDGLIARVVLQPDGKILIGGYFNLYNGVSRNRIARLNADGSLDTTFDPGTGASDASSLVNALALQPDGKILIGGFFFQYNGVTRRGIARLNSNGSLDTTFDTVTGFQAYVITLQPDGKILVGHDFITRLNPDGSVDSSFTSGIELTDINFPSRVWALVPQPDGKILVGGRFDRYNGVTRNNFARVNSDGTLDTSFNPGAGTNGPSFENEGLVDGLALQPDGKVIISGYFNQFNGVTRNHIARVNCDGSLDPTFNSGAGTDRRVAALALQADYKILIGGLFSIYDGTARNNIARLLNDAVTPSVQFSASNYTVQEDCTTVTLTVSRTGGSSCSVASVDYTTANATATDRGDFITTKGRLTFAPGETSKSLVVLINEDSYTEGNETFRVNLSNASNTSLGATPSAIVTINDDASEPSANAIDDPQNFTCQQYHDFLNRQPDATGLAFWTAEINSCGNDQACIAQKRIKVSGEFFLSIEFQNTGYLAERINRVAFGSPSGSSTFGGLHTLAVPILRFDQFLSDARELGSGVVVNQAGWDTVLENNKQSFVLNFVQRATFTSAYPTSTTPSQFVDTLFTRAGVSPTASERSSIIGEFGSATNTVDINGRARAVRRVAENSTLAQQELTRAFVLMEYFGYLRRNPNDPQDTDYTGYDFWLTKLNQFNGNYVNAEMVKAFITSIEYRQRFGP